MSCTTHHICQCKQERLEKLESIATTANCLAVLADGKFQHRRQRFVILDANTFALLADALEKLDER